MNDISTGTLDSLYYMEIQRKLLLPQAMRRKVCIALHLPKYLKYFS